MQKRICSIALTLALVLTCFAGVFTVNAAAVGTTVTFDDYQKEYYESNNMLAYATIVDTADSEHGNAIKITSLKNVSEKGWPQNFKLASVAADGTLSKAEVVAGKKYTVSFDILSKVADHGYGMYLVYCADVNNPGSMFANTNVGAWDKEDTGLWINGGGATAWTKKSFTFIAKKSGQLTMTPAVWGDASNQEIYIDNINIKEVSGNTNITFDEQEYVNGNFLNTVTLVDDGDEHGNTAHFNFLASNNSDSNDSKWPRVFKLVDQYGDGNLTIEAGRKYRITYDIKIDQAAYNFNIKVVMIQSNNGISGINCGWTHQTLAWHGANTSGTGSWVTKTVEFTPDVTGIPVIVLRQDNNEWWGSDADIHMDNIIVEESLGNLTINNASEGYTLPIYPGDTYADLVIKAPLGATLDGLYFDEDFTQPAVGEIDPVATVYAKWKTAIGDFDNAVNLAETEQLKIEELVGMSNSKGLTNIGRVKDTNSVWPPSTWALNSDGSSFKTVAGNTYTVSFNYKVNDPSALSDNSTVALTHRQSLPSELDFDGASFSYFSEDGELIGTYQKPKHLYNKGEGWQYVSYTFDAESASNIYILTFGTGGITYDNFSIIDHSNPDIYNITDDDGNIIFSGYLGEDIELADADVNGDTNRIYYTDANGAKFTDKYLKGDTALSAYKSEIAVTAATADIANNKLKLRVRFDGIDYTPTDTGIKLNTIVKDNIAYNINEIGMLVIPTAELNGAELTLNTEGAKKLSNDALHYTAIGTDAVETSIEISPDSRETEYTVVGYIKTNGKVIYSETRDGIVASLNATAGIVNIDGDYEKFGYALTEADEFNADDKIFDKFYSWDGASGTNLTNYSTSNPENLYLKNVGDDSVLTINSVMKTDTTATTTRLQKSGTFTYGYMEVRAKFASNIGACIWLNSAGVDVNKLNVKPGEGVNDFVYPEIDIAEFTDSNSGSYKTTLHLWQYNSNPANEKYMHHPQTGEGIDNCVTAADLTQWHTYGLLKTADKMEFYLDGELVYVVNKSDVPVFENTKNEWNWTEAEREAMFSNPTYLIISPAFHEVQEVGAQAETYIDYVRIYE